MDKITFDKQQMKLLKKRYLKDGETPEEMFKRVADCVGSGEELMLYNRFFPNSPTLMNAGSKLGQLSACFVLPIEDSMHSIYKTLLHTALVHKSGGGTGFDFSNLRPKGDSISTTGGISSGPISFMKVYDAGTEAVKQGGKRRGANMGVLRIDHPDIEQFIRCKHIDKVISNFNISVAITDDFMNKIDNNEMHQLINPRNGEVWSEIPAKKLWDKIVKGAWKNGEPGVIFIDTINEKNPNIAEFGRLQATNPCGEQPLYPYESCNLGSINLATHVIDGKFDLELLQDTVVRAVEFLNQVIEANVYPLPEIERMTKTTRKIGLGVMGWADALIKLGIKYDSEEALLVADTVMSMINRTGHKASAGRNSTVTTIAPTGSISLIAGCSSGIEPIFAVKETRRQADMVYDKFHPLWNTVEDKSLFRTANDIHWKWHINHQAIFQQHVDNAISKTINMSHKATKEDVSEALKYAYMTGCKGTTVYRNGSRDQQVIVQDCPACEI